MRHSKKSAVLMFITMAAFLGLAVLALAQIIPANSQVQPAQDQPQGQPQAPGNAQSPSGPPMICNNPQLCQESSDFAATVTSFRVSTANNGARILDVTIRFQNKTNQSLILGYVNQSGNATDDRGNRSVPWGPKAYLGIGLVAGSNFDPRFTLRPGSWGDAQFELVQQGWPKLIGFGFTLDLAVSEINSYEGNQHTLGGEFPLHFEGLRNGVAAASPMFSPGSISTGTGSYANAISNPCAAVGQNGKAANALNNAGNAVAAVTSLWHRKKQDPNQAASGTIPGCDPNASAATATTATTNPLAATPTTQQSPTPAPAEQQAVSRAPAGQATVPPNGTARTAPPAGRVRPNVPPTKPGTTTPAKPSAAKPNANAQAQQNWVNAH